MSTDSGAILTLAHWLSPAYPVGAFAYSHGLESRVQAGDLRRADDLRDWLGDVLDHGAGRSDAVLLACAHAAAPEDLAALDAAARAFAGTRERVVETQLQGAAFARTTRAIWGFDMPDLAYPVAVGRAARLANCPLNLTLALYLQAFAGNLVAAAIRLVPLGQTEGNAVLAALSPLCARIAEQAETAGLDDLEGSAFLSDIAAMRHETLTTRIFAT